MEVINENIEFKPFSISTTSLKSSALASTLKLAIEQYKEVVVEYQQLQLKMVQQRVDFDKQNSLRELCKSCINLQENLDSKDNIIQAIASQLTVLNETKNFTILDEVFKLICGDVTTLTPKDSPEAAKKHGDSSTPKPTESKDESVSEIEGTPTGRTSPIILSRKMRGRIQAADASKKKCSNSWPTPEPKQVKLSLSTPGLSSGKPRARQTRLQLVRPAHTNIVDLTSSPSAKITEDKPLVKSEPLDGDETIMPSPTSGPVKTEFNKYKLVYTSPAKCKKAEFPRIKTEITSSPTKGRLLDDATQMEHSINLFNPNRYKNSPCKFKKPSDGSKVKKEISSDSENVKPPDPDETRVEESMNLLNPYKFEPTSETFTQPPPAHAETDVSLSILRQLDEIERRAQGTDYNNFQSPSKRPLSENVNAHNVSPPPAHCSSQASVSVLSHTRVERDDKASIAKRKTPEKVEPLYKEPTVRKKADKKTLPGWSCEECKNFYSELYSDNHEMLSKLMEECSRHRGRNNPAPPGTPPGFWQPRWTVPDDTEAFNARNGC